VIRFEGISKSFPGVQALNSVSFGVKPGSIHALMGENGAGKSTLLKILSGAYQPDAGKLVLEEQSLRFSGPSDAIGSGIAVIYQELNLLPELSLAENLFLGHLPAKKGWLNQKELHRASSEALARVGLAISPNTKLGELSLAQRQMVEIAKALSREARVIAFDEPTSSLSSREVETLFSLIRALKDQGRAILYVSHRLDEIFTLCDAATVLRDGRHVSTCETLSNLTPGRLVQDMVGRELTDIWGWRERSVGAPVLEAEGVTVRAGELVGLFGLVGAGRTELLERIYQSPRASIRKGVCLCPEDRKKDGIIAMGSVQENINLSARRGFSRLGFWLDERAERANAAKQIGALSVKTPSPDQPIGLLSGGNQQKAILGRWLSEKIKVLLLDEPTRGIDIGAKREIYEILYAQAEQGVGVLLVSSELPEVLGICDRVYVLCEGKIVKELSRAEATPEICLKLALPVSPNPDNGGPKEDSALFGSPLSGLDEAP
jgi:L-arabinose transport system ATP-binding protein